MHQRHRRADAVIVQRGDPAEGFLAYALDPGPDCLDHENVGQPGNHGFATGQTLPGLARDETNGAVQPAAVVDVRAQVQNLG